MFFIKYFIFYFFSISPENLEPPGPTIGVSTDYCSTLTTYDLDFLLLPNNTMLYFLAALLLLSLCCQCVKIQYEMITTPL